MKAALINRYFDLCAEEKEMRMHPARGIFPERILRYARIIENIKRTAIALQERYGYDIALNGSTTI